MRIVIDTSAQESSPTVTSTPGASLGAPSGGETAAGMAPAAFQGSDGQNALPGSDQPIAAGSPSADLLAAIAAASPALDGAKHIDGGSAPLH